MSDNILSKIRLDAFILKVRTRVSFKENLLPKIKYIPNAMKFGNQSRSSLFMIFEIVDLDLKLKICADLLLNFDVPGFYKISQSEQIEHANY